MTQSVSGRTRGSEDLLAFQNWTRLDSGARVILLVDSCGQRRQRLIAELGLTGNSVLEVSTTAEAVTAISGSRFDLVMVAHSAPELGAVEFCRMLKRAPATQFLPVFIVFEAEDLETEVKAIDAGADEVLARPFRPRAIQARIQASMRQKALIDELDNSETVLFSLAQSVEQRDPGLGQHCERLATIAAGIGLALGLPNADIVALHRGGYLHDIGKVAIPDQILFKEGPLTPEEWDLMKTHTDRGVRICRNIRALEPVLPIIRHHHERWDGSGYPCGLKGNEIPLLARILQVADIYDALTTKRVYKSALSPQDAVQMIRDETAKGWRDPQLVSRVVDLLPGLHSGPAITDLPPVSLQALAASLQRFSDSGSLPAAGHVMTQAPGALLCTLGFADPAS